MMRWLLACLLWLGVARAGHDDSTVSEMRQRQEISEQSRQLLRERKFAELEAMGEEFRSQKSRLPSGLWKLFNFYEGLERPGSQASGQDWAALLELLDEWRAAFPQSPTRARRSPRRTRPMRGKRAAVVTPGR